MPKFTVKIRAVGDTGFVEEARREMLMADKRAISHEPEEELLGPEELAMSVENLNRAMEVRRWELIGRSISENPKAKAIVNWLVQSGFCKDEQEAILRALETLFFAIAPESEREKVFAREEKVSTP